MPASQGTTRNSSAEAQEEIAKPRRSHTAAHGRESKAFDTAHIPRAVETFSRAVTPAAGYGGVADLPDSFVRGINQAAAEAGSPLQFLELNVGWGPIPAYTLTTIAAFNAAVKARLLPDQRRFVPADQEEALASTFAARLAKIVHGS